MSKEDFYDLTPNEVLNAVESAGFQPTGEFSQLNSYENRVFDVRLEDKTRVVAKFYRPGRWTKECILEEHEFLNDIKAQGLPAVAPLQLSDRSTLMQSENSILFALWPKAMGRMVDELQLQDLEKLGRTLARFHNIGESKTTRHRPIMNAETYGWQNLDLLEDWVAPEVGDRYFSAATRILNFLEDNLDTRKFIRIHGDCHRGNILKSDIAASTLSASAKNSENVADIGHTNGQFFFLDFDDFCMGHPMQDFWMLLSDDETSPEGKEELSVLTDSYSELRNLDDDDFILLPALRGLRILHYAAWIARRWEDPSFPKLFPQFLDYNYWATETEALEKMAYRL